MSNGRFTVPMGLGCSLYRYNPSQVPRVAYFASTIEGVTIFTIVFTLVILKADKGVVSEGYRLQVNRNSDCRGTSLYRAISSSCSTRD
jgi:hypothetical protein